VLRFGSRSLRRAARPLLTTPGWAAAGESIGVRRLQRLAIYCWSVSRVDWPCPSCGRGKCVGEALVRADNLGQLKSKRRM